MSVVTAGQSVPYTSEITVRIYRHATPHQATFGLLWRTDKPLPGSECLNQVLDILHSTRVSRSPQGVMSHFKLCRSSPINQPTVGIKTLCKVRICSKYLQYTLDFVRLRHRSALLASGSLPPHSPPFYTLCEPDRSQYLLCVCVHFSGM